MSLLSVDEARERILSQFQSVKTETVHLTDSSNRVLAEEIRATNDLPLFDNSSMDGFAVRAADVTDAASASPRSLRVVADIPAGTSPTISLAPGQAARIMTGAPMPQGADAVVPVEETNFHDRSSGATAPDEVQIFKQRDNRAETCARVEWTSAQATWCSTRAGCSNHRTWVCLLCSAYPKCLCINDRGLPYSRPAMNSLTSMPRWKMGRYANPIHYVIAALIENAGAYVYRLGVAKDNYESVKALFEKAVQLKCGFDHFVRRRKCRRI